MMTEITWNYNFLANAGNCSTYINSGANSTCSLGDHLEKDGEDDTSVHGTDLGGEDPGLCKSSRANACRSPPPPTLVVEEQGPPNWRGSIWRCCCMAHEGCTCTIGSKREDKSYVAGMEKADGRSDIERGGDVIRGCGGGGGGGGGDGSSRVVKWACKYESSACKFTTCTRNLPPSKKKRLVWGAWIMCIRTWCCGQMKVSCGTEITKYMTAMKHI